MFSWILNRTEQTEWKNELIVIPSNENEQFESHGNRLSVIVPTAITRNKFGLYNIEMAPMARGPKLHYHKLMDETFIVTEGTVTVLTAEGETEAGLGTVIHIPRLSAHGYNNNSDGVVKMTMIFSPGLGREYFFRKMYQMLEETPNDLLAFQKLYLENDSYPTNENNMIPMQNRNKKLPIW